MIELIIAKEFSDAVGGRYITEGAFSGEEFRNNFLIPKYELAKKQNSRLQINFDGGYGYPTSFLEEAFGGLARIYEPSEVIKILSFVSLDNPKNIEKVIFYIKNARNQK